MHVFSLTIPFFSLSFSHWSSSFFLSTFIWFFKPILRIWEKTCVVFLCLAYFAYLSTLTFEHMCLTLFSSLSRVSLVIAFGLCYDWMFYIFILLSSWIMTPWTDIVCAMHHSFTFGVHPPLVRLELLHT
jgi:hypothetical protein